MKRITLLISFTLVIVLTPIMVLGEKPSLAPKSDTDTLILEARLLEIPGSFPPNDIYDYVYIMKYRVAKVIKGNYAEKEILVGHYNPLIPRSQIKDKMGEIVKGNVRKFEEGEKHRLVLVAPISTVWKDAIQDEYFDSERSKYFALQADVMK